MRIELKRTLDFPMRGEDVEQVQRWLGLDVTGVYTERTKRHVEMFQREHGLTVDGLVGPVETWPKMIELFEAAPDPAYDWPPQPDDPGPPTDPPPAPGRRMSPWLLLAGTAAAAAAALLGLLW